MKILFAIAFLFGLSGVASWAAEEPVEQTAPQKIRVGAYILNIGKFDLSTGTYTVDFYLNLRSDRRIGDAAFEFLNGRAGSLDKLVDSPLEKTYRIQANLYQNISLRDYPFDAHTLSILLEDKSRGIDEVVYESDPDNSGIDPDVTIVGWELTGHGATVTAHAYPAFGESYSRYRFDIRIRRIVLTAILKAFLPAVFIVAVGLLSLLLKPDKLPSRLGLNTSSLLGAVMFHLAVTSQIPPVGYLTFADKFMLASYVVLAGCLVSTVILMRHTDQKEEAKAERIYRAALIFIPPAGLGLYGIAFLTR